MSHRLRVEFMWESHHNSRIEYLGFPKWQYKSSHHKIYLPNEQLHTQYRFFFGARVWCMWNFQLCFNASALFLLCFGFGFLFSFLKYNQSTITYMLSFDWYSGWHHTGRTHCRHYTVYLNIPSKHTNFGWVIHATLLFLSFVCFLQVQHFCVIIN